MKQRITYLLSLSIALTLVSSCGNKPGSDNSTSKPPSTPAAAPALTLDVIVGGPFAFVQSSNCGNHPSPCLSIWVPKIKGHTTVIGFDADEVQPKGFDSGDYDFTGLRQSTQTTMVTPVQDASIYKASAQSASPVPAKKPFATMLLPTPREIVSWNADPITITGKSSTARASVSPNLATLTVLRFDYQDGDQLEIKTGNDTFWKPHPQTAGAERILVIGFVPLIPGPNQDEHIHAREAFKATASMLGMKWTISFDPPPASFKRNRPFDPKWPLPQDLLNLIDSPSSQTHAHTLAAPAAGSFVTVFGKINDCKAPAIVLTP